MMAGLQNRRDWMKAVAVAASPLVGCGPKAGPFASSRPRRMTGYIDAHVHVWTPDTEQYPLAPEFEKKDMRPASFTPEELFQHMRGTGVDRVNLIQMSYYGFDNSYMLDAMARYPDQFVGTAIVDPLGTDPAGAMSRLAEKRCYAFRITPGMSKQPAAKWLQPPGMDAMFAAGAKHHLAMSCLIDPTALPELDRMCLRYPDTPVIIDHICRIGIGDKIPINEKNTAALEAMAQHKNVYLKLGAFYALGARKPPYHDLLPMIRRMVNAFSPQRCMWETDCPFQVSQHRYEDSLALIRDDADFLSSSDKQAILRDTAQQLLFRT